MGRENSLMGREKPSRTERASEKFRGSFVYLKWSKILFYFPNGRAKIFPENQNGENYFRGIAEFL